MGYYPKIYTLGSATEVLKKPEKPIKRVAPDLKEVKKLEVQRFTPLDISCPKNEDKQIKDIEKVLIAVPCYKTIHIRTAWSIIDTLRATPKTDIAFQSGVFVHQNDNDLVEIAKEKKASHIFFVEHDNVFEPDTLNRLLELDKDVVAAPYSGRKLPREPLIYQKNKKGELYLMSYDMWPDKPFKAFGVSTGCTLVKMSVFDKIDKPYFFFEYTKKGVMKMSQDIYFSKKVNDAGMECWVDPRIKVSHIGEYYF